MPKMNEVRAFAYFSNTPSDEEKRIVEEKLRLLIEESAPDAQVKVLSGDGSWWIVLWSIIEPVAEWLLSEFASWSVEKGMDKLIEGKPHKSVELPLVSNTKSSGEGSSKDVDTSGQKLAKNNQITQEQSQSLERLVACKKALENTGLGLQTFTVSEWSSERRCGRVIIFNETAEGSECFMHQTDSKEDFDSYTRPS